MEDLKMCDNCGFETENAKSFSNHVRHGCTLKSNDFTNTYNCKECGKICKRSVPSKNPDFCSMDCYTKNRLGKRIGSSQGEVFISGYKYIYKPDHPNAMKGIYVAEHRLIAEEKIGRLLKNNEDVHHINENKLDNRPENLMVLSKSEHARLHKLKNYTPCEIIK